IAGYQFRWANYTGNATIGAAVQNGTTNFVHSTDRNFREHYAYLGVDHSFRHDLTASAMVGARFIDYYNDPTGTGNGWGPYAMVNVVWTYAPDSRLEVGVTHDISASDVTGGDANGSSFTVSQETTVL